MHEVVYVAANIAWDTCLLYVVDCNLLYRDVLNCMNSAMVTIWGLLATLRVNQQNGSPSLIEFHGFEAKNSLRTFHCSFKLFQQHMIQYGGVSLITNK